MPDPVSYQSNSPRHALPLLFAAQAQKEVIVNESLGRLDALLHLAVEGEGNNPPATPADGECWLIGASPTGAWAGHGGMIASFSGGDWLFLAPRDGMQCWNGATSQFMVYANGWTAPARPASPAGGSTIDSESRQAIEEILDVLQAAGITTA